ncbi:maleylacetoacetate isomerase [Sedimenticola sp.]|uniref:maleylacetoacetate isomerase n=1 Tax=Sedimenticola sp. TaxID=1940285 RepID=UPI003D0BDD80
MITLYDYFRSTAAYRVRIVLNLKGIDYRQAGVNLLQNEESSPEYRAINPQGLVPALDLDGHVLQQSLAICEYLDERHPEPALLSDDPLQRAHIRALAQMVACDIHPVNNSRILKYLVSELGVSEAQKLAWYHHWLDEGFRPIEQILQQSASDSEFCCGDRPTLADVCLVPQVFNARRFELDLTPYPTIVRIEQTCLAIDAFERARPENQPDAV